VWEGTSEDERRALRSRPMRPASIRPDQGTLRRRPMTQPATGHGENTPVYLVRRTDRKGSIRVQAMATRAAGARMTTWHLRVP
jgi:hypothetical protein